MNYSNRFQKEFSVDIITLFCDIDYFLFLSDKGIVAYSEEGNSASWNLHVRDPKKVGAGSNRAHLKQEPFFRFKECHSYTDSRPVTLLSYG